MFIRPTPRAKWLSSNGRDSQLQTRIQAVVASRVQPNLSPEDGYASDEIVERAFTLLGQERDAPSVAVAASKKFAEESYDIPSESSDGEKDDGDGDGGEEPSSSASSSRSSKPPENQNGDANQPAANEDEDDDSYCDCSNSSSEDEYDKIDVSVSSWSAVSMESGDEEIQARKHAIEAKKLLKPVHRGNPSMSALTGSVRSISAAASAEKKQKKRKTPGPSLLRLASAAPSSRKRVKTQSGFIDSWGGDVQDARTSRGGKAAAAAPIDWDTNETATISFDDLPTYYTEGTPVFFAEPLSGRIAAGVVQASYFTDGWSGLLFGISIKVVVSNGYTLSYTNVRCVVPEYADKISPTQLPVRRFDSTVSKLKGLLQKRGAKYVQYALGVQHLEYKGSLNYSTWSGSVRLPADGRVMIDLTSALRYAYNRVSNPYDSLATENELSGTTAAKLDDSPENYLIKADRAFAAKKGRGTGDVIEPDYWMAWPTVMGYSFRLKTWGALTVDTLEPVKYRTDAIAKLSISEDRKKLIKTLVKQYMNGKNTRDDLIAGKGGGLMFLLHGPPGVGKTLTAEAVADFLQVPLYSISISELGYTPDEVEKNLAAALELGVAWDAVVLLDEADIFMEQRSNADIIRNAMVGVFLRKLEYFPGVLFLTSNRASQIDTAFMSRLALLLEYPTLTLDQKTQIWTYFLGTVENRAEDVDKSIPEFANSQLDGRQIKTLTRMAAAISAEDGVPLDAKTISLLIDMKTNELKFKDRKA